MRSVVGCPSVDGNAIPSDSHRDGSDRADRRQPRLQTKLNLEVPLPGLQGDKLPCRLEIVDEAVSGADVWIAVELRAAFELRIECVDTFYVLRGRADILGHILEPGRPPRRDRLPPRTPP